MAPRKSQSAMAPEDIFFWEEPYQRPFPDPAILLCPNTPRPLHEITPRSILGSQWWDIVRKEAYARHGQHCAACGVHKDNAKAYQRLEAHELYRIDFAQGTAELIEVVALCHYCHGFIHDNRQYNILVNTNGKGDRQVREDRYLEILEHGNQQLQPLLERCNGWRKGDTWKAPYQETVLFPLAFPNVRVPRLAHLKNVGLNAPWHQWRLILCGQEHPSKFRSEEDWRAHYERKNTTAKPVGRVTAQEANDLQNLFQDAWNTTFS